MATKFSFKRKIFNVYLLASVSSILGSLATPLITPAYQHHPAEFIQDIETSPFSLLVPHQGMISHIRLSLKYGLKDDSRGLESAILIRDAAELLMNYPEEYDYWEVVNLSITQNLLEQYSQLEHITLELEILPREHVPYHCISTVTRWAQGHVEENWRFEVNDLLSQERTLDAAVSYSYKAGVLHPDFLDIRTQLGNYLNSLSGKSLSFEELEETLEQHLLQNYAEQLSDITVQLW
ncbi:hypothetical protein N836_26525 [Leptolyngbya sp. Heron Island J]|uniref:hypothetical protein n=1 Tax=Leptolyngbya sp. Heron Island J TaxID=1385935 RepID=UPI0003B94400|nr:hypothetical protein [Leptolyngbya sp. Heron Island J]ESA32149.1 hypothetical protein N836_26525 [Leptolyngbya sp. Heron Island J]